MRISDLNIACKLGLYIVITTLLMAMIGYTGYHSLQTVNENIRVYSDRVTAAQALAGEQLGIRKMQIALLDSAAARPDVVTEDTPYAKQHGHVVDANEGNVKEFEANWEKYKAVAPNKPEIQADIAEAEAAWQSYRDTLTKAGKLIAAGQDKEGLEIYVGPAKDATTRIKKVVGELEKDTRSDMKAVEEANEAENKVVITRMLEVMIAGFVIVVALTIWIVREIRRPLRRMTSTCQHLYDCDFREHQELLVSSHDEFGAMSEALEAMRLRLRKLLSQIKTSSGKVTDEAQTLSQISYQSAQASSQIANSVNQAAGYVEQQQQAMEHSAAAMQAVADSVATIKSEAGRAAQNSGEARQQAVNGADSITDSTEQMGRVQDSVQSAADLVDKLGNRSKVIGNIVDTITEITGQTNLLALNAAIEAARAGEAGRGFAVVADEVRKLAEQSQEAAEKISGLVTVIQSETMDAVNSMADGRNQVDEGTHLVQDMSAVFQSIEQLVVDTATQMESMAKSVDEAANNAAAAAEQEKQMRAHSVKVNEEMQSVSAASEEQSASAEEVAAASETLNKLAAELNDSIKEFKF